MQGLAWYPPCCMCCRCCYNVGNAGSCADPVAGERAGVWDEMRRGPPTKCLFMLKVCFRQRQPGRVEVCRRSEL